MLHIILATMNLCLPYMDRSTYSYAEMLGATGNEMLTVVGFLLDLFSLVSQTYLNPKQTYILHELQRQNKKDNQEMVVMWTVVTRNPALPLLGTRVIPRHIGEQMMLNFGGVYTQQQAAAKALAVLFGGYSAPKVHHSGYYGHYHDSTHSFHIWFGGVIRY